MAWLRLIGTKTYGTRKQRQVTRRLHLEPLEDRQLLATCHVVRLGDFGAGADLGGEHSRGDLRYCITKANDEPGSDTILIQVNGTINLTGPLPDLVSEMEIVGPGSGLLTIRRDTGGEYRIITVAGDSASIRGVTLSNGTADVGGGIYNQGSLTLNEVTVSSNTSTAGFGGGIYNAGVLTVAEGSHIINNFSTRNGGGLCNSVNGTVHIDFSTIAGNIALKQASSGDKIEALGGGICSDGTLVLISSVISGNTVIVNAGFGLDTALAHGGGIGLGEGATTNIVNSTIAQNVASIKGGADFYDEAAGGGIFKEGASGSLSIMNSTIAHNAARCCETWHDEYGGGMYGIYVSLQNSIIANNTANHGSDIYYQFTSQGYNLISVTADINCCYAPTDILDVDPMLGPLQDNGGPTQTMALLPGSPAIDSGDPNPVDPPQWDQRGPGFPRIVNGTIDRGAFEVQATGAPPHGVLPFHSPMANCPNDDPESFKTMRSRVTAQNPPVAVDVSCSPPILPSRARIRAQNRLVSDIAAKSAVDAVLGNLF